MTDIDTAEETTSAEDPAVHEPEAESDGVAVHTGRPDARFEITADLDTRVVYAMAYNRRAPVRSVTIRNLTGGVEGPLSIEINSSWTTASRPPLKPFYDTSKCPAVGMAVSLTNLETRLDDEALALVDETAPALIKVTVTDAAGYTQTEEFEIDILPRNQWNRDLLELTAAFVQPSHLSMAQITTEAAKIAERMGEGLVGYLTSPEGVDIQAKALYEALSNRVDNYLISQATFDKEGQRVRPLDEVLQSRQGNCIELACAYASALLAAKLHPIIFFVHGHAFAGYFTEPPQGTNRWPEPAARDLVTIMTAVKQPGLIRAVETTMIAGDKSFEEAIKATALQFADRDLSCGTCNDLMQSGYSPDQAPHMDAALDVFAARRAGVKALPARSMTEEGLVIVIDQGPDAAPVMERRDPVTERLLPKSVPARVQQWKNALLDLSRGNPLINFKAASRGISVVAPDGAIGAIEDALADGLEVKLFGDEQISEVMQAAGVTAVANIVQDDLQQFWRTDRALFGDAGGLKVISRAKLLNSRAVQQEQETGVNNLYLGIGSISWLHPTSKDPVTSPLFLVPVRMTLRRGQKVPALRMDPNAMTTVNYCLLEALRGRYQMKLSWFAEDMSDNSGLDIEEGLKRLRGEVFELGLTEQGVRVDDSVMLGIFAFDRVRLWKDLDEHWESFVANPVVNHLVNVGTGIFQDPADPDGAGAPPFDDTTLLNPQPADGAQTRAIARALAGHSFVLEGPPGTGKSQTITNLLANALASGRKVLFVAEKQAALEVVRERLEAVGLDPFCLNLHDGGSKPEAIKEQLREALEFTPNADFDRWDKLQQAFEVATGALDLYRARLHHPNKAGRSFFDAYRSLLAIGDEPAARIGRALVDVDAAVVSDVVQMLLALPSFTTAAQPAIGHPWQFVEQRSFEAIDRAALAGAVASIAGALPALPREGAWGSALGAASRLGDLRALQALIALDAAGRLPQMSQWRALARADWMSTATAALDRVDGALADALAVEPALPLAALGRDLGAQAVAVREAASGFFMGRKGKVRSALGDLAGLPVFANAAPADVVQRFDQLAAASASYRAGLAELRALDGLDPRAVGDEMDHAAVSVLRTQVSQLSSAASALTSATPFAEAAQAALNGMQSPPASTALDSLLDGLDELFTLVSATPSGIDEWIGSRTALAAIEAALPMWQAGVDGQVFISLKRWIDLLGHVAILEQEPFADFRAQILSGEIRGDEADTAFERALLRTTLIVVGEANQFDVFDQTSQDRLVARFVDLLKERETLLRSVIPAMLHDRRSFDAGATVGSVGQLRMELTAKRRGARSVRDLLTRYPELILELTPCLLMSTDSVAKFIPPGTIEFDLVVFDEASQIAVEDAVGSMGRAKAVVVVGDSKQMPPSKGFATSSVSGDDEETALDDLDAIPQDEESILEECVESGLPREMLEWHYRSRDEVLISFSNERYYGGRLASFPAPVVSQPDCGFVYHRVNGQFNHSGSTGHGAIHTNPIEAEAIVAEVQRRANDPHLGQFTMGVVTLNKAQKDLIERRLNELEDPVVNALLDHEDPEQRLFVLNLENVQGRERDVVILGTSFSKRADGGAMPLRFGPLVNRRGERRLNVAVTRARRQVVVFSSFDPIDLAAAKSTGLVDLALFLEKAQYAAADRDAFDQAAAGAVDPYIEEVAEALRSAGLIARTGYGLSTFKVDIAVTMPGHEGRWLAGVLLDGVEWGRRSLALDRDALPVTVLQNMMNWPAIARVWLPAWRRDRAEVIADITDLVHRVAAGDVAVDPAPSAPKDEPLLPAHLTADREPLAPIVESHPIDSGVDPSANAEPAPAPAPKTPRRDVSWIPDGTDLKGMDSKDRTVWENKCREAKMGRVVGSNLQPSRHWEPRDVPGGPDDMEYMPDYTTFLLGQLADIEGPVAVDPALKRVAREWGLERVRAARLEWLRGRLPADQLIRTEFGDFIFPADCVDRRGNVLANFTWYRQTAFADRKIDEIAPHEVANACVDIVTRGHSISDTDLRTEILVFFGYGRRTAETLALAGRYIDWAVTNGYLQRSGDMLRTAPREG